MNKILTNKKQWKAFTVSSLFNVKSIGAISIEELEKKYGAGEFPYVTRTANNNGISGFYDYKSSPSNVLTIETTLSGLCFYHDYEFSTGDHIAVLIPKGFILNKYIALFIKTIWRKNHYKFDYGRPATIYNIKKIQLILPTKDEKPDWIYMEEYIKSIESSISFKNIPTQNIRGTDLINTEHWKWFEIRELFDVDTGKDLLYYTLQNGEYPVIGHKALDNGVTCTTQELDGYILYDNTKTISLADRGNFYATVQLEHFYIGTRVKALKAKFDSNIYRLLFICTLINKEQFRFSYGRNCCANTETLKIKLPVNTQEFPDWKFMEDYIKNLPYGDLI